MKYHELFIATRTTTQDLKAEVDPEPSIFLKQERMKETKDSGLKMKKEWKVCAHWKMKSHSGS